MNYLFKLIKFKFFTRINKNYITFISFNGKYADSPKYLTDSIHKLAPEKKIIWLVDDINNEEIPDYVIKIKYNSKKAWDYYCKSKIIIDNVYCMNEYYLQSNRLRDRIKFSMISYLKNKKGKKGYSTWHGTPIKKIGLDSINSKIIKYSCPNTTMVLDNQYVEKIQKRITMNTVKTKVLGSAKASYLLNNENIDNIKKKLNLPTNRKFILFAPSFRNNGDNIEIKRSGISQLEEINIDALLDCLRLKFGGNWSIICRFHYHVEKEINWEELYVKYGDKVINGNAYPDIIEYLKCSDILLTDMSSCLFDMAIINKPIILFFPDIDYYKDKERGLYFDIKEMPFPCAISFNDLTNIITKYDYNKSIEQTKKFLHKLGFVYSKNDSDIIANFILEDSKK